MTTVRPGGYEGGVAANRTGEARCCLTDPWNGKLMVLSGQRDDVLETIPFGTSAPIAVTAGQDGVRYVVCQSGSLDMVRP